MLRSPQLMRLAASALLLCASSAHAQYSWIGENGVRQFSDRPPPPSTPAHKILKAPGRAAQAVQQAPASALPAPGAAAAKAAPTLAEREAAYRDRVKGAQEQENKAQQEAQRQRDLAERCLSAFQVKAQTESGMRVSKVGANGERSYMTDEEKAADAARANKVLAQCR